MLAVTRYAIAITLALLAPPLARPLSACSCVDRGSDANARASAIIDAAPLLATASLDRLIVNSETGFVDEALMEVDSVFIGPVPSSIRVDMQPGHTCQDYLSGYIGQDFDTNNDIGQRFLLGLEATDNSRHVTLDCVSSSLSTVLAQDTLAAIERQLPAQSPTSASGDSSLTWIVLLAVGVYAAMSVGAVAFIRLRRTA